MKKGLFITFEGIDGGGKTTQCRRLFELFGDKYALLTSQPGGFEGGADLKSALLNLKWSSLMGETLAFLADRAEHIARVIAPALQENKIVLCDRYHDSTAAYQCYGKGFNLDAFKRLSSFCGILEPDITFLLDISASEAMRRLEKRGIAPDCFEREGVNFLKRVRGGYLRTALENKERFRIIDALLPEDEVHETIMSMLHEL